MLSPLVWAYVGDAVYELYIRTNLVNESNAKPKILHIRSIGMVSARSQSEVLEDLDEFLTEEERDIVRRGRNVKNAHVAKNASTYEYSRSTGFEALIGYLFLMDEKERLEEILTKISEIFKEK